MIAAENYVLARDVARVLDRSVSTVQYWRESGDIISPPYTKVGGSYLYSRAGLAKFVERIGLAAEGHGADYIAARLAEGDAA